MSIITRLVGTFAALAFMGAWFLASFGWIWLAAPLLLAACIWLEVEQDGG